MVSMRAVILLFSVIFGEELDRQSRTLDSQGFKALIEIGKLINNFGIDNIESHVNGFLGFISKNLVIFYFLIFASFLAHFVTFFLTLIAVKSKPTQSYNLRRAEKMSSLENMDTNEREYWPAAPTVNNSCETFI